MLNPVRWSHFWCSLSLALLVVPVVQADVTEVSPRYDYASEEEIEDYTSSNSSHFRKRQECYGTGTSPRRRTISLVYTYDLVIEWGFAAPDNFRQRAILINGQFPGPEIVAKPHSTLVINVHNKLDQGFTIHMHGIHQAGTIGSDGVPHVTQYEIPPCGFYKYVTFIGNQAGTFLYHAHTDYDALWAFGALILQDPTEIQPYLSYQYDYEKTIILSQCFHEFVLDIASGLTGAPFQDVPDTDSLLINGKSWGRWPSNNTGSAGYEVIDVRPNKKYRLRLIGFGVDSMLSFTIKHHKLKVIEVDGILVAPFIVSGLQINIAQRYSVIVETNQPVDNYEIITEMVPGPGPRNGFAIFHYQGAPSPGNLRRVPRDGQTREREVIKWPISKVHPSPNFYQPVVYPIPPHVDKEIMITSHQVSQSDGQVFFDINGVHFVDDTVPLLLQLRAGATLTHEEPHVFQIHSGDAVQIVFQNLYSSMNGCEQHPWHMHGHSFYVVGHGPNEYNSTRDASLIEHNVRTGRLALRDVSTLYVDQSPPDSNNATGTPCGWLAIRFRANNPGFWLVHCHIVAHQLMGKKFTLYEHSHQDKLLTGSI